MNKRASPVWITHLLLTYLRNPLSKSFCQELRVLATQYQGNAAVRFAYVDLSQDPMTELKTRYKMKLQPPTTITIVNGGFWRVRAPYYDLSCLDIRLNVTAE